MTTSDRQLDKVRSQTGEIRATLRRTAAPPPDRTPPESLRLYRLPQEFIDWLEGFEGFSVADRQRALEALRAIDTSEGVRALYPTRCRERLSPALQERFDALIGPLSGRSMDALPLRQVLAADIFVSAALTGGGPLEELLTRVGATRAQIFADSATGRALATAERSFEGALGQLNVMVSNVLSLRQGGRSRVEVEMNAPDAATVTLREMSCASLRCFIWAGFIQGIARAFGASLTRSAAWDDDSGAILLSFAWTAVSVTEASDANH